MAEEREPAGRLQQGTTVWSEDQAGYKLSVSRDAKRTLPASWRIEYRAEDGGRNRADSPGRNEAWAVLECSQGGTAVLPAIAQRMPRDVGPFDNCAAFARNQYNKERETTVMHRPRRLWHDGLGSNGF